MRAPLSQYSRAGQPWVLTASCSTACMPRVSSPWPQRCTDHVPGVIVEQREQHRALALDDRAVQPVADPQLVGFARLEPAECLRRHAVRAGAQLQAGEVALQGARRGRPPLLGFDDPGDVRGGAGRAFPFEPGGQLQHLGVGARGDLAFGRDQRVEPAGPPRPDPAVQTRPRHRHRLPGRAQMHLRGQLPHQPAALARRQARIGQRPDQRIPIQRDIPRPIRPGLLLRSRHRLHLNAFRDRRQ